MAKELTRNQLPHEAAEQPAKTYRLEQLIVLDFRLC